MEQVGTIIVKYFIFGGCLEKPIKFLFKHILIAPGTIVFATVLNLVSVVCSKCYLNCVLAS